MRSLFCLLMIGSWFCVNAQSYHVFSIDDSLRKNAAAVIRYDESIFIQTDLNNAVHKVTEVITILSEDGKHYGDVVIPLDKFRDLKSFSGTILDASGKVIKKIGKKDLNTTAYSSHLASDDKYSYYKYQPAGYPYTVSYDYEVRIKNGIPYYPKFVPINGYRLSVEQAKYQIQVPQNMKLRYKSERMPNDEPVIEKSGGNVIYEWSVTNLPAIERESYSPGLQYIIPMVQIAPNDFCMEGQCGNMSDWNSLGKWINQLKTGRTEISPQLKEKLLAMTADAASDKEKVNRIYQYLQSTTRYVSIQLGIGGFQPMSAADVEKSGFGDCKALSNYMQSMLTAIGIPSLYTVISLDRADLYSDFASLGQMNHIILAVPMPSDTLWLECTSQNLPFNFAHGGIAGHQCLVVTPQGGEICKVKKMTDIDNSRMRSIYINVDGAGNGEALIKTDYKWDAYEEMQSFVHNMSREEQINTLSRGLQVVKSKIHDLQIFSNDTEDPDLQLKYQISMEQFANKSGSRLFVPFSLIKPSFATINPSNRRQDIMLSGGILRIDTLSVDMPAGYVLESLPQPITLNSIFGNYVIDVQLIGSNIKIIQHLLLKKGRYPANAAEEFYNFCNEIEKASNRRAVFKQT